MGDKDNKILKACEILIDAKLNSLKFNYYLEGKITADNADGTYDVLIRNESYTLKTKDSSTFTLDDIVFVLVPNGDFGRKFIDCIRP